MRQVKRQREKRDSAVEVSSEMADAGAKILANLYDQGEMLGRVYAADIYRAMVSCVSSRGPSQGSSTRRSHRKRAT